MDSNGTRYHLLLGFDDWRSCSDGSKVLSSVWGRRDTASVDRPTNLNWNDRRSEVTLKPLLYQYARPPREVPLTPEDRRGAAADRYGNWYWIADSGQEIVAHLAASGSAAHFWSAADGIACDVQPRAGEFQPVDASPTIAPLALSGLTVTSEHYLVVGVLKPDKYGALLIFDLHSGGPPREIQWPARFEPYDMSPAPEGGLWILDKENRCYWGLDRFFRILEDPPPGTPLEGALEAFQVWTDPDISTPAAEPRRTPVERVPSPISLVRPSPLDADQPVAIEGLPDGSVLILETADDNNSHYSFVHHYRLSQRIGEPISTRRMIDCIARDDQAAFRLRGHDFAFVSEEFHDGARHVLGRLTIAEVGGNQSFAFYVIVDENCTLIDLKPLEEYLPMRLFVGKGLVTHRDQVFYDFADRWIPLVRQKRPRYEETAELLTPDGLPLDSEHNPTSRPPFDSRQPDCVWHRLMIDGCIPPGAEIRVYSRAANRIVDLAYMPWEEEPPLYRRGDGSELPYVAPPSSSPDYGTWELLLQRACGRFLQLRLILIGDHQSTPTLRALRVYYPRFSYLEHYLPTVYREDAISASFLDRFLANIEGMHTTIEGRILAAHMLIDARSAPSEALDWLAGWFGLILDPSWDDVRRRLLIRYAAELFRYRGTLTGLLYALQLAISQCPDERIFTQREDRARKSGIRIMEKFRTRRLPAVLMGDRTEPEGLVYVPEKSRWHPEYGAADLHKRYADFRFEQGLDRREYLLQPADTPQEIAVWRQFSQEKLGFVPTSLADDVDVWDSYLRQRYQYVGALPAGYLIADEAPLTFDEIPLPDQPRPIAEQLAALRQFVQTQPGFLPPLLAHNLDLWGRYPRQIYRYINALPDQTPAVAGETPSAVLPPDGAPLHDWYEFQSLVLSMHRSAHRFTVLLPVPEDADTLDPGVLQQQLDKAIAVIDLEKPAHTVYDVKFYWDMFRVGEVRLGYDTEIGRSSRNLPVILGQSYLAAGYLASPRPDLIDQDVVGRGQLRA